MGEWLDLLLETNVDLQRLLNKLREITKSKYNPDDCFISETLWSKLYDCHTYLKREIEIMKNNVEKVTCLILITNEDGDMLTHIKTLYYDAIEDYAHLVEDESYRAILIIDKETLMPYYRLYQENGRWFDEL